MHIVRILRQISVSSLILVSSTGCPSDTIPAVAYTPLPGVSAEVLAMEQLAYALVNDERTRDGDAPLTMREDLRRVARAHSEDMVARNFFDHTNPDNETPWDRMRAAGITWNSAGENIAWNNYSSQAEVAVNGWMGSTGHRNNILNDSFTHTGMGVAFDGAGGAYFTQVFIGISKAAIETHRLVH